MLEEHRFGADGRLETIGAGKYRIPSVSCTPLQMNVTLLKDSGNTKAVYSSKVSPTSIINVTFIYDSRLSQCIMRQDIAPTRPNVCLCLKFLVGSIYDPSGVVNYLFHHVRHSS